MTGTQESTEESLQGFTSDGTAVLSTTSSVKSRLMSISVAELLAPGS